MDLNYIQTTDFFNDPYLSLNLTSTPSINVSLLREERQDIASLLFPFMKITLKATGPFSSDLTSRDDVLIAFISLLLLLVIESVVTTILLQTDRDGVVSNFRFAIKQVIELIKEFNISGIFSQKRRGRDLTRRNGKRNKLNVRLLSFAFSILFLTVGLEVAVLFLTNVHPRQVTNDVATFRVLQPVVPEWLNVLLQSRISINRPCEPITLENVLPASTRINGCVNTNINFTEIDFFDMEDGQDNVSLVIVSRVHEFGSDHQIFIDGKNATYSQRTLFNLGDGRSRIMASDSHSKDEEAQMKVIHQQYIAYLFSLYEKAVKDKAMNLERLQNLLPKFTKSDGGLINVLNVSVPTRMYVTTVTGIIPKGVAALRIGQHYFRGIAAVVVSEGNVTDLFVDSGIDTAKNVLVWEEDVRDVNWLTLFLVLTFGIVLLVVLRLLLKPVSTAEIAGVFVKDRVGVDQSRSPIEMASGTANRTFKVSCTGNEEEYLFGAEVPAGASNEQNSNEYLSVRMGEVSAANLGENSRMER